MLNSVKIYTFLWIWKGILNHISLKILLNETPNLFIQILCQLSWKEDVYLFILGLYINNDYLNFLTEYVFLIYIMYSLYVIRKWIHEDNKPLVSFPESKLKLHGFRFVINI